MRRGSRAAARNTPAGGWSRARERRGWCRRRLRRRRPRRHGADSTRPGAGADTPTPIPAPDPAGSARSSVGSCRGARPLLELLVPAVDVAMRGIDLDAAEPGEIQRSEQRAVGNRRRVAGDELARPQPAVDHLERVAEAGAGVLGGLGRLLHPTCEERMRVLEDRADAAEHAELADALGLAHAGTPERGRPDHRGRRMEILEVLDDGERLRQAAAVVELQHWEAAEGVLGEELGGPVLPREDVDGFHRDLQSLLGQVDAQLLRVRRAGEVVNLHRGLSLSGIDCGPALDVHLVPAEASACAGAAGARGLFRADGTPKLYAWQVARPRITIAETEPALGGRVSRRQRGRDAQRKSCKRIITSPKNATPKASVRT